MINEDTVIDSLLRLIPRIEKEWKEHLGFWGNGDRGRYNDITVFAQRIVDDYESKNTGYYDPLFEEIENIIINGDYRARDLIGIGLLEDIQTISSWRSFGYSVFEKWMKKNTLAMWKEIIRMWDGKNSLMDVVREEKRKQSENTK
jgi:hypothetical protein